MIDMENVIRIKNDYLADDNYLYFSVPPDKYDDAARIIDNDTIYFSEYEYEDDDGNIKCYSEYDNWYEELAEFIKEDLMEEGIRSDYFISSIDYMIR